MAYNLQSLITILEGILNPEQPRWTVDHNKPQLQSLLQKAESLLQILESSSLTKIASLEGRIRDAAYKAQDIIESQMVHQMLSAQGVRFTYFTPYLHVVMHQLDSAKEQMVFMEGKTMSTGSSSSSGASFSHDLAPDVHQATQDLEYVRLGEIEEKKMLTGSSSSTRASFSHDLTPDVQQEIQEPASVKLVEVEGTKMPAGAPFSSFKNDLVGVDEDLLQLKDRLTNMERQLEIIPIVGMGGIGKSTLARNLYDDSLIVCHFEYRGWAVISQDYNMRAILLNLLRGPNEKLSDELIECKDNELKEVLYKRLYGRRYMIVLDDVWSTKFWDEIRMYFPVNNNGSRIMITTRELGVANFVADSKSMHNVQLLNESASWDLLRQIVFGEEDCPNELQGIGAKIASDCDGLPLAIHVIGGLLSKVEISRDVWEHISTDVKGALVESGEQFFNILSLSYKHLPIHLKPCFLYMGSFPEDSAVKSSRLVHIWIAEGFVKSNGDKSLEEEAEDYLKALVERNLLSAKRKRSNGKPMDYSIHDLLRDLCIRKANEEKFLHVKNSMRRVSVHSSYEMEDVCASPQSMSLTRSFICTEDKILPPIFPVLKLLRVLHAVEMVFEEFPQEILELVNLRYLAFSCTSGLPIGISRLSNLQTLISKQGMLPFLSDIWEISELRFLKLNAIIEIEEGYKMKFVLKKLQTLYYIWITPSLIRSGFFEIIPNIIKLGIYYEDSADTEVDLSHLQKLKSLRCESNLETDGSRFLHKLKFPCNLRKLNLGACVIFESFLTTLCALPNLEVLKIIQCVFESEADEEWNVTEGDEFRSLQCLQLEQLGLVRWRADETNFPRLQKVFICLCHELEEIPCAIGDIPTLQLIQIDECNASVVASAQEIQKVQQDEYDNYDLKVIIW